MDGAIGLGLAGAFFLALRDIFGRPALRGIDPIWGTAATAAAGEVVLALFCVANGDFRDPWPGWGNLGPIAVAGILRITLARTILFAGIKHIGAARASSLAAANVFFAMCLAMVFLGETLTGIVFVASAAIAAGCVFITRSHPDSAEREGRRRVILGTVLSLGSAAAFGASSVFVRPVIHGFTSPVLASFYANTFAILTFLPYGLARPLTGEARRWSRQTAGLLALSGLAAAVGTIGNYAALKYAPVLFVQPLLQTRPFFVVIMSRLFFQAHEQVNWKVALGATLVMGGTVLLIRA